MDEAYYDNLMADTSGVVSVVPPWLKALDFVDDITGLYAIFDLETLFENERVPDRHCFLTKFGLMQVIGAQPFQRVDLMTKLTLARFYRFVKNSKAKIKVINAEPFMRSDRSWAYQVMYRLQDQIVKSEWSKIYVGMLSVTPPSSSCSRLPILKSNQVITVDLTGDPEHIEACKLSGVCKVKCSLTVTEQLVGRNPNSNERVRNTSDSGFFGRLIGRSRAAPTELITPSNSHHTLEHTLLKIGHASSAKSKADDEFEFVKDSP